MEEGTLGTGYHPLVTDGYVWTYTTPVLGAPTAKVTEGLGGFLGPLARPSVIVFPQ